MEDQEIYGLLDLLSKKIDGTQTDLSFLLDSIIELGKHVETSLLHQIELVERMQPGRNQLTERKANDSEPAANQIESLRKKWGVKR